MAEPFLELQDIGKTLSRRRRARRREPRRRARRGDRPRRRERRRQVDADEGPRRRRRADAPAASASTASSATAMTVAGAIAAGIAFVHQELNLFDNLDAAGNVFIGREPRTAGRCGCVDRRAAARPRPRRSSPGSASTSRPDAPVAGLSLAQRQLRRDRQGAVARQPARHHGRADLEPDAHRDRAAAAR